MQLATLHSEHVGMPYPRVYMSMGQFEKAIPQFQHCLELREQQMGTQHSPFSWLTPDLAWH